MKALSFYIEDLKTEYKNLVSTKICGSLKMVCRFSTFIQKVLTSAKLWKYGYQLVHFSKASILSWCTVHCS